MARRWGRKSSQVSDAEKDQIAARYRTGEKLERIARDHGISPGQVSNICLYQRGCERRTVRAKFQPVPEPVAPVLEHVEVAFVFEGHTVRRDGDYMSLTELWRAAGSPIYKRPAEWLRREGKEFVEHVSGMVESHTAAVFSEMGGRKNGSTWAFRLIALAYAEYLSPALHRHVLEVYTAYVDGELVADSAETEARLDASQADAAAENPELMAQVARTVHDVHAQQAKLIEQQAEMLRRLESLDQRVPVKRCSPVEKIRNELLDTCWFFYEGKCISCRVERIMIDGVRTRNCHIDHFTDNRSLNAARHLWPICAKCNRDFAGGKRDRGDFRQHFDAFHSLRKQLRPQGELDV